MFQPTQPQLKFKSKLYQQYPQIDVDKLSPGQLVSLTKNRSLMGWLADPDFREWLANKDYTRQLLIAGAEVAVKRLWQILECDNVGPRGEVTAAAQVNAAKLMLEYAGYNPPTRKEVIYKDKDIAQMDEQQLRDFIQNNTLRVVNED